MTREEAWNRIDAIIALHEIDDEYVTLTNRIDYDALRMARKALEQEPCGDCVSREAVLDTLDTADKFLNEDRTVERYKAILTEAYEVLPSVNPQKPKCEEREKGECPYYAG